LLFSYSCKKEAEKVTISGNVYNTIGGEGVSSATAYLYGQKVSSSSWNTTYTLLGSSAISGGSFSIEIEKENISSYKLEIVKTNFFKREKVFTSDNFSGNTYKNTYYIDPSAEVTIVVKNTSYFDENDYLKYTMENGFADYDESCGEINEYTGQTETDTIHCFVIGDQEIVISTLSVKNNVTAHGEVREYCAAGENTEILIQY
jgi:hypothetical protein